MAKKNINVKKHPRKLPTGRVVPVKKHKREIDSVSLSKNDIKNVKSGKSKQLSKGCFIENVNENPKLLLLRNYKGTELDYGLTTTSLILAKSKIEIPRKHGFKSYYFIGSIKGTKVYRVYIESPSSKSENDMKIKGSKEKIKIKKTNYVNSKDFKDLEKLSDSKIKDLSKDINSVSGNMKLSYWQSYDTTLYDIKKDPDKILSMKLLAEKNLNASKEDHTSGGKVSEMYWQGRVDALENAYEIKSGRKPILKQSTKAKKKLNSEDFNIIVEKENKPEPTYYKKIYKNDNEKRLRILELMYYDLFFNTKDIAKELDITTEEAYKHMKWLEKNNLVVGEAYSGTGISTPKGTYKTKSLLWEPYYCDEKGDDLKEVMEKYEKAIKPKKKPKIEFKSVKKILNKSYPLSGDYSKVVYDRESTKSGEFIYTGVIKYQKHDYCSFETKAKNLVDLDVNLKDLLVGQYGISPKYLFKTSKPKFESKLKPKKKSSQPVCPECGSENYYSFDKSGGDDSFKRCWHCPDCNHEDTEWIDY